MDEPSTPRQEEPSEDSLNKSQSATSTPTTAPPPPTEENMEERYNKLKTIAVKLKKRINEQNEEIAKLEKEKSKYQNASKIQLEFDKAQDEVERLRNQKKVLEKDLQAAVEENVRLKVQTTEDNEKLQSLTASHKTLRERLEKVEVELAELEEIKSKAARLEKELQDAKEAEAVADQEKRQSAILSLEITDYEKKLQDATKQLEEKKVEVEVLRTDLSKRSGVVEELERTVQDFKEKTEHLQRVKESLQADIQRKLEKITFLQDEMNKLKEKLGEKNLDYIKLEQEYENSKLTFASQSKELVEKCDSSLRMIATLEHKISVLEDNKRSRESQIANLKLEIQQLESEYSNYKTKAQAMLKSQKPSTQEEQSDELENLQKIIQNFQSDISILKTDIQTLKLENDNLLIEKSELNLRLHQTKTDSIEKEMRLSSDLQRVKEELRQKDELFKIQLEEVKRAHSAALCALETKMQNLKEVYEDRIRNLQDQLEVPVASEVKENGIPLLESVPSPRSTFRPIATDGAPALGRMNSEPESDLGFSHHSQPLTIDTGNLSFEQLRMLPRGECEGSESAGSAFTPRVSVDSYLTFEQLLNTSSDSSGKGENEKVSRDGINFKDELRRSQNQVAHLTALLRESESNCERLTQLSEALKEEIRRVEREKERKEHLKENTEYLKNVLLKFMTLSGGDERKRLIPVMKTMLQLTNEEVQKLENTVDGRGPHSSNSKDGGAAGWSSYLPMWGGADKH